MMKAPRTAAAMVDSTAGQTVRLKVGQSACSWADQMALQKADSWAFLWAGSMEPPMAALTAESLAEQLECMWAVRLVARKAEWSVLATVC